MSGDRLADCPPLFARRLLIPGRCRMFKVTSHSQSDFCPDGSVTIQHESLPWVDKGYDVASFVTTAEFARDAACGPKSDQPTQRY
jgi:hypothetical protein